MASAGPSYIVVNNEAGTAVSDAVSDLVGYILARSPPSTELDVADLESGEAFLRIAEHAAALLRAPPADFEGVLNLLWFVLASAPNFDEAAHVAVTRLTDALPAVVAQQAALEAVLVSLFNILPSSSAEKAYVFSKIVALAKTTKSLAAFGSQLPQIAAWLAEWPVAADLKREIVLTVASGLENSDTVRQFLATVVAADAEFDAAALLLAKYTILEGDVSSVLELAAVQRQGEFYEALKAINAGDFAAFASLGDAELKEEPVVTRARVAALARLASSTTEHELTYDEIAAQLHLVNSSAEFVEPVVVEAMRAGVLCGRMNQLEQKLLIESTDLVGDVTEQHWDVIEQQLRAWQRSLKAVLETTSKARNGFDATRALNKLEV